MHLTGATLKEGDWCLRVPYPEHVTLGNATFTNCGLMKPVGDHDVREFEKLGDDYWTAGYKVRSSVTGPKDSPASAAWSLSGDDAGQLEINAGSGVLTFADPGADFEARSDRVYTATIQAVVGPSAAPLATVEQDVKITVLDVPAPDAPAVTLDPDSGRETAGATVTLDDDQGMRVRQVLARLSSVPVDDPEGTRQWHPLGRPNAPGSPSEADGFHETSIAYTNDSTYESWKESGTAYEWSVSPDRTYRFEAKLENLEGESEVGSVSYTPPPRDPLTISGPATPFYYIDWTAPIGTYTAADSDGDAVTGLSWTASDDKFVISEAGQLSWATGQRPAYSESGRNEYEVNVEASSSTHESPEYAVTVTLRRNTAGQVSLTNSDPPTSGETMVASLTDPDDPKTILSWTWARISGDDETPLTGTDSEDGLTSKYQMDSEDVGARVRATVTYDDAHQDGATAARTTAAVEPGNSAPTISGEATVTMDEHSTTVASYEADDPDAVDTITWQALEGADADSFEVEGTGNTRTLRWRNAPDYEKLPKYQFTVVLKVRDNHGALSDPKTVTVKVRNIDEPGTVTLSTYPPKPCAPVSATLRDPDGGITLEGRDTYGWMWPIQDSPPSPARAPPRPLVATRTYTPKNRDVGKTIQATVQYGDAQGPNKSATSASSTTVVANIPRAPGRYMVTGGVESVRLAWTKPDDCGSEITEYQYKYRRGTGDWTTGTIDKSQTSHTISGLDGGVEYQVQLRARNGVSHNSGYSAAVTSSATTIDGNDPPTLEGPGEVTMDEHSTTVASYGADDPDAGDTITWEALEGADADSFEVEGTGNTRTLRWRNAPNYEELPKYQFTVALKVRDNHGALSDPKSVTVKVRNIDEPGTVTFSTTVPKACGSVTATLRDPDGGINLENTDETYGWAWTAQDSPPARAPLIPVSVTESYEVRNRDVGKTLRASVLYGDSQGPDKSAAATTLTILANVPKAPGGYDVTGGVESVRLAWTKPDDCGSAITEYQYKYRRGTGNWTTGTVGKSQTSHTISGLDGGVEYQVQLRARNGASHNSGYSAAVTRSATTQHGNRGPTLDDGTASVAENSTAVGTYTATDPDAGDVLRWSLSDETTFSITASSDTRSGTLVFDNAPNYETKSSYSVVITVTDQAGATDTGTIGITVTNEDDPGVVILTPSSPRVGDTVRAALTDEDGVTNAQGWAWSTESSASSASGEGSDRTPRFNTEFDVTSAHVGQYIKASRSYDDNHGSGKSATGTTGSVRANKPKAPPNLRAARGDGEVTLTWDAADDQGATIDRYNYRYKTRDGTYGNYKRVYSRSKTIDGLTNGTEYDFQVRGHNSEGFGPPSSTSATPAGKPDAPSGFSHGRSGANSVTVSWDEPEDNGSAITGYYWYKRQGPTWSAPTWVTDREFTDDNSWNARSHRYAVRSKNGVGESDMAEYTVPAEEQRRSAKPVADFADSTGFGVMAAPNPFNPETAIFLALPEAMAVSLTVYGITGQEVASLREGQVLEAGLHSIRWAGRDDQGRPVGSGIYLYRLLAGTEARVGKMLLIR